MSYHKAPRVNSNQQFLPHMLITLLHPFAIGIPIAMLAFAPVLNAQDVRPGDTAYYCERSGSRFWSKTPCEEIGGTELRRGRVADSSGFISPDPVTVPVDAGKLTAEPEDATAIGKPSVKGKGTFVDFLPFLIVYLLFSAILGWWASRQNRSSLNWFLLSLIFTPSLIFWVLLFIPRPKS